MNKKSELSQGRILRERLELYIKCYVPPHKRKKKNPGKKFASAYSGTYEKPLNYHGRGQK